MFQLVAVYAPGPYILVFHKDLEAKSFEDALAEANRKIGDKNWIQENGLNYIGGLDFFVAQKIKEI